ncbi:hypothetical protein NMY22_g4922 [Coprinellus aureogranulatus]|nr:hypothetical protein NMY22_g4922 [Coprinellus aureogranulatus]
MSGQLEAQALALYKSLREAQKELLDIDPRSVHYQSFKNRVHRSSQIVEKLAEIQRALALHCDIDPDDDPFSSSQNSQAQKRPWDSEKTSSQIPWSPTPTPGGLDREPEHCAKTKRRRTDPDAAEDSEHEDDRNDKEQDRDTSSTPRPRTHSKDLAQRAASVMAQHSGRVHLHARVLVQSVVAFREGKSSQPTTDAAASRLFNLYAMPQEETLDVFLDSQGILNSKWKDILNRCKRADRVKEVPDKLKALTELAVHQDNGSRLIIWVTRVINTILALNAAVEYNKLAKAEKTKYIARAFEEERAEKLRHLRSNTNHQKTVARERTQFKKAHNKRVNARNLTFRLYQVFGANVVAEPLLQLVPNGSLPIVGKNLNELTAHLTTHREIILREHGLLEGFRNAVNGTSRNDARAAQQYFDACHTNVSALIVQIVAHIAGEGLGKYVETFFARRSEMLGLVLPVKD